MVDTVIRLFESTATSFTTNGIGAISDAISATVVEERNGEFELEMTYSVDGRRYNELTLRRLLVCKPNPFADPQAFRIYEISKPINGIVTVRAEHISYDLSGYVVGPFTADSADDALSHMQDNSTPVCPFILESDNHVSGEMYVSVPSSIRSLLGGTEGSVLDVFSPGEYEFNNYNVKFWNRRGSDDGVTIRYGKNLTDLEQEENCSNIYTAVYPYWFSEDDGLVTLTEKIVNVSGTFNYSRVLPVDLTEKFDGPPDETQLRSAAQDYITSNKVGIPKVSLTISFVQLAQSEEYKKYALLEAVHLCDTVNVEFPKLGVSATAKCIKTTYNVLTGKYISIELGETRSNLSSTIAGQGEAVKTELTTQSSILRKSIDRATKLITGGLGGYVILHNSAGGETPDELLVLGDDDDYTQAQSVWRWNRGGLGYSSTGYNGPFGLALTNDGQIVADRITTGSLYADRIRGGILKLGGTTAEGSYGNGVLEIYNSTDNQNPIGRWDRDGLYVSSRINVAGSASSYFKSPFNADASAYIELDSSGFKYHTPYGEITNFYGYDVREDGSRTFYNCALKFGATTLNDDEYSMLSPTGFVMSETGGDNIWRSSGITVRGISLTQRKPNDSRYYAVSLDASSGIRTDNCHLYVDGTASIQDDCTVVQDFRVYGYKSRICKTDDYSERLLYCYETPSPYFGDIGEGIIGEDGLCYITVDPVFAQTITSNDYQVFLQSYGEEPVTVLRRRNGYFVVSGDQGTAFGWEVKAKQFDFDQERLDRNEDVLDINTDTIDYGGEAMNHIREIKQERISA